MSRISNFYAGPSVLPEEVLKELSNQIIDFNNTGLSLIETSHRSKTYDEVHNTAINLFKELFNVPSNYHVLFLQGGGTLQFGMIPMNFLSENKICDFAVTGAWSRKAYDDAVKIGNVNLVFDGKESNYTSLPKASEIELSNNSSYLYITSNETIGGIQWKEWPDTGRIPLICDMSSDILSRPVDVSKFGMIYAGAQKNLGPSGVTIAVIRDDLLSRSPEDLPAYLNYNSHVKSNSLYNTPPVFPVWALKLVLERMKNNGGLEQTAINNEKKAAVIYDAIDCSEGFYNCPVDKKNRSLMNIVFTMKDDSLQSDFLKKCAENNLVGLKGHKSVGGLRASVYNSLPMDDAEKLSDFMRDFYLKNK